MTELIPAVKKWNDPALYPRDFYLNFTSGLVWHERSFMLLFLKYSFAYQFIPNIFWFYLISFFLAKGISRICFTLGLKENETALLILILLFIAPYSSVGGNELHYPMLNGSVVAKCLAIWGIWYFITDRNLLSFALLGLAVWFQALVGLQLGLILGLVLMVREFKRPLRWLSPAGLFGLFAFPCLLLILGSRLSVHAHTDLFQELVEFRIGHHFYIQYSSFISIHVYLCLAAWGSYYWKRKNVVLFHFFVVQNLILILYLVSQWTIDPAVILQSQWLKTTLWIEFFALVAMVASFQVYFTHVQRRQVLWACMLLIGLGMVYKISKRSFSESEESRLAAWAHNHTDLHSLFVVPPDFSCFKSQSERSLWVDYKSVNHQLPYLAPWYDRIHKIYGISLDDRRAGRDLMGYATEQYSRIKPDLLLNLWKQDGVNYFILPAEWKIPDLRFEQMYQTPNFQIVRCRAD